MGIALMENFDVADVATLATNRMAAATPSGYSGQTVFNLSAGSLASQWGLRTFTEKGVRRTSLGMCCQVAGGSGVQIGGLLRIPLPPLPPAASNLSRSYYMSMRLRFLGGNNLAASADPVTAAPLLNLNRPQVYLAASFNGQWTLGSTYSPMAITNGAYAAGGNANKMRLYAGPSVADTARQAEFSADAEGWFQLEIYKPAGSMVYTLWLNDFMYIANSAATDANVVNANTDWLGIYLGRTQLLSGSLYYGFEITDLIVIDPTTAGQKYRFGSSGRVLSMDYTSDVTNEWVADPAATLAHREMMMIDKSVPDATNILTALNVAQREKYAMQAIPSDFGPYVPALQISPRVMNGGAAPHTIAMEMDWGTGNAEVGSKMVAPGGAYDTTPIIITTKPNGDPWTAADFANAKVGFSVKS